MNRLSTICTSPVFRGEDYDGNYKCTSNIASVQLCFVSVISFKSNPPISFYTLYFFHMMINYLMSTSEENIGMNLACHVKDGNDPLTMFKGLSLMLLHNIRIPSNHLWSTLRCCRQIYLVPNCQRKPNTRERDRDR